MKIAFFEVSPEDRAFFQKRLKGHDLYFFEGTINETLTEPAPYEAVSLFVRSRLDDEVLEKLPRLRYLQTRSTGYDHIRCLALYERNVLVSNVAGYAGPAVGEFAFSLLLNATRKTHIALARTRKGNYDYKDLLGRELFGKRIGILGLGVIGERIARIAAGMGMRIGVFSRTKKPIVDELGIDFTDLESVLEQSDVLMIALPLTPATTHLINTENASLIPEEAIIVNIARAQIIEPSLYRTLSQTICTDVSEEPDLARRPNILSTPHMAYYTEEALRRIREISLENLEAFIEGRPLPNCLRPACEREYKESKQNT